MKRVLAFIFVLMLIASMVVPVFAATPRHEIPDVPQFSQIKFDIKLKLPDDFWKNIKFDFFGG